MDEKLRELNRYEISDINPPYEYCRPYKDTLGEWVKFKDVEKLINTLKHETVQQWETRTGESYPDDGAVWCLMSYTPSMNRVKPYWELIEYGKVDSINNCIVANHHGKPEIEG